MALGEAKFRERLKRRLKVEVREGGSKEESLKRRPLNSHKPSLETPLVPLSLIFRSTPSSTTPLFVVVVVAPPHPPNPLLFPLSLPHRRPILLFSLNSNACSSETSNNVLIRSNNIPAESQSASISASSSPPNAYTRAAHFVKATAAPSTTTATTAPAYF